MSKTILFVYGTLKRNGPNHHLLAEQAFLGEAVTAPRYRLFDLGSYPALVHDDVNGLAVRGELFAVDDCCLAELDAFEEVPDLFVRKRIEMDGPAEVWAYYWNRPVPATVRSGACWPLASGLDKMAGVATLTTGGK